MASKRSSVGIGTAGESGSMGGSFSGDQHGGEEIQHWTAGRKAAVVLDIIKGKTTPADAARLHVMTVADVESWIEKFVEGGREWR
jgi:hypothetical protein